MHGHGGVQLHGEFVQGEAGFLKPLLQPAGHAGGAGGAGARQAEHQIAPLPGDQRVFHAGALLHRLAQLFLQTLQAVAAQLFAQRRHILKLDGEQRER